MSSQQPPPPHISDVAIWGTADRNYWVYFALAVVLGFIGMDHVYLRSYGTAFQKFLFNCVSFGFWYWWDVIQALTEPEKIKTAGLSRPFDWGSQTIGKGVFGTQDSPPKDYVIYTLLAVFLGWLGADRFYLGQWTSGVLKFASVIFLVGWLWVAFDAINAVFFPRSLVTSSGSYGFPFDLFEVKECAQFTTKGKECANTNQTGGMFGLTAILDWIAKTLGFPFIPLPTEIVADGLHAVSAVAETAANAMNEGTASPMTNLASHVADSIQSQTTETTSNTAANQSTQSVASNTSANQSTQSEASNTSANQPMQSVVSNTTANQEPVVSAPVVQQGGAYQKTSTGPVIAGALSALVVAGSLKAIYDFVGS